MGIRSASRIPHQEWTPRFRESILYALEMELARDVDAARQGIQRFGDENLAAPLARLAVVTQDAAAIPLLVQTSGIGSVRAALVAFGRLAIGDLIRGAKNGDFHDATDCLISLRQMVQYWGIDYLSTAERAELKALVASVLMPDRPMLRSDWGGVHKTAMVRYSAQLALVLEDQEAREWIDYLVNDVEVYQAKTDARFPHYSMGRLQDMLNSRVLLPEPEGLSTYFEAWRERGENGFVSPGQ